MGINEDPFKLGNMAQNSAPYVSVVICTRNRVHHLLDAIRSVLEQAYPRNSYELIVVDNASSDPTPDSVRPFVESGKIRYVVEPILGLAHARNTGWKNARGQYVAFFDDDAIATPGWLGAIEEAFRSFPRVGIVGGRVDPIWKKERPVWLSDEVAVSLTLLDWSDRPKEILNVDREWLVGSNMAIPRAVLEEVGGFHPWLDRVGSNLLSSGDVFLQKEIIRRGYACLYYPEMAIRHLVPANRLNQGWFRRRFYWQGISNAMMKLIEQSPTPVERIRLAASATWRLISSPGELIGLLVPTRDAGMFKRKCFALIHVGYIAGMLGRAGR